jgi:hypothetical protein
MLFLDPWGDIVKEHNADSFVDDTSLGCNHDAHLETAMPFPQLIAKGQECAQAWDLYSSSSTLELQKCFWYLVYWQWVGGRLQRAPTMSCPGIIALTGGSVPNYTGIP